MTIIFITIISVVTIAVLRMTTYFTINTITLININIMVLMLILILITLILITIDNTLDKILTMYNFTLTYLIY